MDEVAYPARGPYGEQLQGVVWSRYICCNGYGGSALLTRGAEYCKKLCCNLKAPDM